MKYHAVPTKALQELCGALEQQDEAKSGPIPSVDSIFPYYLDPYLKFPREKVLEELGKLLKVDVTEHSDVELSNEAYRRLTDAINLDFSVELAGEDVDY